MKTLYIECNMGAAGDMLMAALLELLPGKEAFLSKINSLGLEDVHVNAEPSAKCGINGTRISVIIGNGVNQREETSADVAMSETYHAHNGEHGHSHGQDHRHEHSPGHVHNHDDSHHEHSHDHKHEHSHAHTGMKDIAAILSKMPVSEKVKKNILGVYELIAEAESRAHGRPVNEVHFHEVGNLDAVADIAGVCLLLEELAPEKITVSPVHVGSGFVRCSHGILPVPAPATAHILRGVPCYGGKIHGELCTPTGAALLKYFASDFGPMPLMKIHTTGYGMGKKDFEAANCVRVFWGESETRENGPNGEAAELRCNVDDMTGEALGFACQALMNAGARDVFTTATGLKKGRPGIMLSCICDSGEADVFAALMLKYTTTFGVRKAVQSRYTLERKTERRETPFGPVRVKTGRGYGVEKSKLEYDDAAVLAKEHNISVSEMDRRIWAYLNRGENKE